MRMSRQLETLPKLLSEWLLHSGVDRLLILSPLTLVTFFSLLVSSWKPATEVVSRWSLLGWLVSIFWMHCTMSKHWYLEVVLFMWLLLVILLSEEKRPFFLGQCQQQPAKISFQRAFNSLPEANGSKLSGNCIMKKCTKKLKHSTCQNLYVKSLSLIMMIS